jgi:signal transduction histidine kinase
MPPGQLINWFGHAAGAVIFGLFFGLLWRDRSPSRNKALLATALALLWNLAELAGLALGSVGPWLGAMESTAFSLLPCVLFDVVIGGRPRWAARAGYSLSAAAALLHLGELVSDSKILHGAGLYLVAAGFGALAIYAAFRTRERALPALAILLLSLSILHFAEDELHTALWVELLVHHAGIPLAMFVLLQDYRFVFLDALIRFFANILVALVFAAAALTWMGKWPATALAGVTGLLMLYAFTRQRVQKLLTQLVFRREATFRPGPDIEASLREYFGTGESTWEPEAAAEGPMLLGNGTEAALGVREATGAIRMIRLGRRPGGRRYLSEDLQVLREAGETIRDTELRRLVSEAELRALQAQIHPHFLFNALNTLYGIIPKEADGARRTVLNLADLFRYFLRNTQTFVSLDEELKVVKAYLEIEILRLGERLNVHFDVDSALLSVPIPLLSIEPLVENAVKHGVAPRANGATVRVTVRRQGDHVQVEVADTGAGFTAAGNGGAGVGLENVRQRLRLCYGPDAALEIESSAAGAKVHFAVPYPV